MWWTGGTTLFLAFVTTGAVIWVALEILQETITKIPLWKLSIMLAISSLGIWVTRLMAKIFISKSTPKNGLPRADNYDSNLSSTSTRREWPQGRRATIDSSDIIQTKYDRLYKRGWHGWFLRNHTESARKVALDPTPNDESNPGCSELK